MQLTIKTPDQFKQVLWKNGKGITQELAINKGANLDNFIWRISMASVAEDGPFSDFTGYTRHLLLLEGSGIDLDFGESTASLNSLLAKSEFDGGIATYGKLHNGPIRDFNVIFNPLRCTIQTNTVNLQSDNDEYQLPLAETHFIYAAHSNVILKVNDKPVLIENGCFAELTAIENPTTLQSKGCIVISMILT